MDPATGISLIAAFLAGAISFISPCVLPLVPGYLAAIGAWPEEGRGLFRRMLPALLFVLSFSAVFIALGASASAAGRLLAGHRKLLEDLAGASLVLMGLVILCTQLVPKTARALAIPRLVRRAQFGSPVICGFAFALCWTPCIGPTLGAVLTAAALTPTVGHAVVLLAFYCAGLALPFLTLALLSGQTPRVLRSLQRLERPLLIFGGVILLLMGVLSLTGELQTLNIEAQKLTNKLGIGTR